MDAFREAVTKSNLELTKIKDRRLEKATIRKKTKTNIKNNKEEILLGVNTRRTMLQEEDKKNTVTTVNIVKPSEPNSIATETVNKIINMKVKRNNDEGKAEENNLEDQITPEKKGGGNASAISGLN